MHTLLQKTIDSAVARGSIIVAAAGNSDEDAGNVNPASCENVITVGATTSTGVRSSFSNYGDTVEISAPGGEGSKTSPKILSTTDESPTAPQTPAYSFMTGTSQAAPHVSGTIALMLATNPDLKTAEVVSILQNTATPMAKCDRSSCGAGIVNAASAVAEAGSKSAKPSSKPSATTGGRTLRLGN